MTAASGGSVQKAQFENADSGGCFEVQYNPKDFKFTKPVSWKEHDDQGKEGSRKQHQRAPLVEAAAERAPGAGGLYVMQAQAVLSPTHNGLTGKRRLSTPAASGTRCTGSSSPARSSPRRRGSPGAQHHARVMR